MPSWGDLRRPVLFCTALAASLWGLSACGLVVGFGRECVDECATDGAGDGSSNTTQLAPDGTTGDGGSANSSGGASTEGSSSNTDTTNNGSSASGAGGSSVSSGGSGTTSPTTSGMGGSTGGSGTGGGGTGGGTGGGGTGGGGTGAGGTGGGGTGGGGTGGDGTGGTGGTSTLLTSGCTVTTREDVDANATGPVQLSSVSGNDADWIATWQDGSSVYLRGFEKTAGTGIYTALELTSAADASSIPVIGRGPDEIAAVAWDNQNNVDWTLHSFIVRNPTATPQTASTDDLNGSGTAVTSLLGITDDRYLVAGVDDGEGVLALFEDGAYTRSLSLQASGDTDTVYSVAAVRLGGVNRVFFVDDGGLEFTIVADDLSSASAKITLPYSNPDGGGPDTYLRAMEVDGDLGVVWLENGRVYAGLFDASGQPIHLQPLSSSGGNNRYPNLAQSGGRPTVSWLDANMGELYLQRMNFDFTLFEEPTLISSGVGVEVYGFGGDQLGSNTELYAAAFNTSKIELVTIACDP